MKRRKKHSHHKREKSVYSASTSTEEESEGVGAPTVVHGKSLSVDAHIPKHRHAKRRVKRRSESAVAARGASAESVSSSRTDHTNSRDVSASDEREQARTAPGNGTGDGAIPADNDAHRVLRMSTLVKNMSRRVSNLQAQQEQKDTYLRLLIHVQTVLGRAVPRNAGAAVDCDALSELRDEIERAVRDSHATAAAAANADASDSDDDTDSDGDGAQLSAAARVSGPAAIKRLSGEQHESAFARAKRRWSFAGSPNSSPEDKNKGGGDDDDEEELVKISTSAEALNYNGGKTVSGGSLGSRESSPAFTPPKFTKANSAAGMRTSARKKRQKSSQRGGGGKLQPADSERPASVTGEQQSSMRGGASGSGLASFLSPRNNTIKRAFFQQLNAVSRRSPSSSNTTSVRATAPDADERAPGASLHVSAPQFASKRNAQEILLSMGIDQQKLDAIMKHPSPAKKMPAKRAGGGGGGVAASSSAALAMAMASGTGANGGGGHAESSNGGDTGFSVSAPVMVKHRDATEVLSLLANEDTHFANKQSMRGTIESSGSGGGANGGAGDGGHADGGTHERGGGVAMSARKKVLRAGRKSSSSEARSLPSTREAEHPLTFTNIMHALDFDRDEVELYEEIGRGGSGTVYRASIKGFSVACKVYQTDLLGDVQKALVRNEVMTMELLSHPSIVPYLGHEFSDTGTICVFLEYFKTTLRHMLDERIKRFAGILSAAKASTTDDTGGDGDDHDDLHMKAAIAASVAAAELQLRSSSAGKGKVEALAHDPLDGLVVDENRALLQVAEGLAYLHDLTLPVVHRDLKCENVFVHALPEGGHRMKIGDFGEAKRMVRSKKPMRHSGNIGTPEFMAPEVVRLEAKDATLYNERADIWSFGMMTYELVTGITPFHADDVDFFNLYEVIKEGTRPKFPEKTLTANRLPLHDLFWSCTQKTPNSRPSADALVNILREVVAKS